MLFAVNMTLVLLPVVNNPAASTVLKEPPQPKADPPLAEKLLINL